MRRNNLQATKLDHFNIKSWKARVNRIYKDVFMALTYLGFYHEGKANNNIQIFCFLARTLSLLDDRS